MAQCVVNCLLASTLLLLAAGCGEDEPETWLPRVPASGTVRYKGEPVEGATVVFSPVGDTPPAIGRTDEQGRFQLQTYRPGDGAVPGEYRITVRKSEIIGAPAELPTDDAEAPPTTERPLLPDKYSDPSTSGFVKTVAEGQENDFTLELEEGPIGVAGARGPAAGLRSGE